MEHYCWVTKVTANLPEDYIQTLSSTSGLPHVMVRRNMQKIYHALTHMRTVLTGLTRGLDLSILDKGYGEQFGHSYQLFPDCEGFGPGHAQQLPAVNTPVAPSHSTQDARHYQTWEGGTLDTLSIDPGLHSSRVPLLRHLDSTLPTMRGPGDFQSCGRALIFGDQQTTAQYANNPGIQIHGPGFSKILMGEDQVEKWGRSYRFDGRLHIGERRTQLHQCFGCDRSSLWSRDC